MKQTSLHDNHLALGARMVDFAGWRMPLHYGSQLDEHHRVRRDAGMFDVSHMMVLDLAGEQTRGFLRYLLANDVAKSKKPGKALYSCMLNESGGVMDDLIVYFMEEGRFRLVLNAATREKDLRHIRREAAPFGVTVHERTDLAIIAVQGPNARDKTHRALATLGNTWKNHGREAPAPFFARETGGLFVARTGYTGEDGYEIIVPNEQAPALWQGLLEVGVGSAGLGARDTLRLEAGLNLYGQDMTEETSPLESGLGWTVAFEPEERDFIGRAALEAQRGREAYKLVGLKLEGRGMLRAHQRVSCNAGQSDDGEGETTSGGFSPTLGQSIALARVPVGAGENCAVEIRGKQLPAMVVKPPFVKKGARER